MLFQPLQLQACVMVEVMDDDVYEGDEQLMFQLSNPENATLGIPSEVTITIIDNGELRIAPFMSHKKWVTYMYM